MDIRRTKYNEVSNRAKAIILKKNRIPLLGGLGLVGAIFGAAYLYGRKKQMTPKYTDRPLRNHYGEAVIIIEGENFLEGGRYVA